MAVARGRPNAAFWAIAGIAPADVRFQEWGGPGLARWFNRNSQRLRQRSSRIGRIGEEEQFSGSLFCALFRHRWRLISCSADFVDQFRQAATYVARILRGEAPADLSLQAPTNFELAINLKTANALGLAIPATILSRADEVIE
jgi:hypothetical protein